MKVRECPESPVEQGAAEQMTYALTTTIWASSPTEPSMTVKRDSDGEDVTDTVTSGSMSVNGDVITLKAIGSLTVGERYRVNVLFTCGAGTPWNAYFYIDATE